MTNKIPFNKETIVNLPHDVLAEIKAGMDKFAGCWENLWTVRECEYVQTSTPTKDVIYSFFYC